MGCSAHIYACRQSIKERLGDVRKGRGAYLLTHIADEDNAFGACEDLLQYNQILTESVPEARPVTPGIFLLGGVVLILGRSV